MKLLMMKNEGYSKTTTVLYFLFALLFLLGLFWYSSLALQTKIALGEKTRSPMLLLNASELLARQGDQDSRVRAAELKIQVARWQIADSLDIISEQISLDVNNPRLYVQRSRIYTMLGDYERALDDLKKAKAEVEAGPASGEILPTSAYIEDIIERVKKARDERQAFLNR